MPQSVVEEAVKVLMDFEDELAKIKLEAGEAKKRFSLIASEEGGKAKKEVLTRVQSAADEKVATARRDAENEAASMSRKGKESLESLKQRIAKKKGEATAMVVRHLLED